MPHLHDDETLKTLEFVCAGVLTFELMLRTFVGTLNWKRMLLWEWTYWLDVLSLLPFYLDSRCWTSEINDDELPDEVRSLELLRLLRILKLVRHYADWRVLMVALQNSWRALLVPTFAMLMTILVLSGALFLAEGQPYDRSNPYRPTAEGEFRDGFEAMWTIFWIVTTLGTTTGPVGQGTALGRLIIAVAVLSGLLFTTMPITIVGEAFRTAWEKKELLEVQMKIQQFLEERNLTSTELHEAFREFDTSGDNQLDWGEFKGALKKLGVRVPVSKMRQLFALFDEDETGEVDYFEFCRVLIPNLDIDTSHMLDQRNCDSAPSPSPAPRDPRRNSISALFNRSPKRSSNATGAGIPPPAKRVSGDGGIPPPARKKMLMKMQAVNAFVGSVRGGDSPSASPSEGGGGGSPGSRRTVSVFARPDANCEGRKASVFQRSRTAPDLQGALQKNAHCASCTGSK